jgi:predicted HicB family RNase H-like nuclease
MNTLVYKDFVGSFNYIEEEEILYGKIQGISDLVTFEGASIAEVKNAFIEAVDDYIELCKEVNKDPYKSFKGTFNVRISSELHRQATLKATRHNLNLNQFVQKAIEKAVHQ